MTKTYFFIITLLIWSSSVWAASSFASVPFLVFDLQGGAALPGNFLVGKANGPFDLLKTYDLLGWNPLLKDSYDTSFGLPMNRSGQIWQGILSVTSSEARANLRLASILNQSMDDTSKNLLSALPLIIASGNQGSIYAGGVGLYPTLSGGYSGGPKQSAATKPLALQSMRELTSMSDLMIDPRQSASHAANVYHLNRQMSIFDRRVMEAGIVANVLMQNTGPGTIVIEDCDYHDGSSITGDATDFRIGVQIGRAIELAYLYKKPLFFQIITDGGLVADRATRNWIADDGRRSMTVIGYYSPLDPIDYQNGKIQLGAYTDEQVVDDSSLVGASPEAAADATFANYLSVVNQLEKFSEQLPDTFPGAQLSEVLLFSADKNLQNGSVLK